MKKILLILFYMILFVSASILLFQMPYVIAGEKLFCNTNELILSLLGGAVSGLIMGLFNIADKEYSEE